MPALTTSAAFDDYDRALNLDPPERARAELFHNQLTLFLKTVGLIVSAFLQGSFRRKTMLKPLRDIDKVVILAAKYRHLLHDPNGAQTVATLVEDALRSKYPDAKFERARHAIQIDLGDDSFSFDVVPGFEVDDGTGDVWIMDLGTSLDQSRWKRSNTRTLIEVVATRNTDTDGAFVHQVRHIKHWVRTKLNGLIPGLHVEAIAYACITEKLPHDVAAERVLRCGAQLLGGDGYYDPTGVDKLSDKLTTEDRQRAAEAFAAAAAVASEARRLTEAGDHGGAIAQWYSIFGDPFPTRSERDVISSAFAGARITDTGNPTARGHGVSARPVRSWRRS